MALHFDSISRRRFLTRSLLGGVAVLTTRVGWAAEAAAEERWALLSDTHISEDLAKVSRNVNMADHLQQAVAEVAALAGSRVRQVLVNGDLSLDHALPGDYTAFMGLTKPILESGQALHLLMGNHDGRDVFYDVVKSEAALPRPVVGKHVSVVESGVANWFLLDSLIKTLQTPGEVGAEQLAWLGRELDARADKPALVMVHHDPIPRADGKPPGLTDRDALMAVLRPRKQVKAVFCGHTHKWNVAEEEGIQLVNLPAVAYPFSPTEATGWTDCVLKKDGMRLTVNAIDKAHALNGKVFELRYRS